MTFTLVIAVVLNLTIFLSIFDSFPIEGEDFIRRPLDCGDIDIKRGSGVYKIYPENSRYGFNVYCDMDTEDVDGGWTVFQRRLNGKVSFNRGWSDYKDGFGTLKSEHWLGNEKLHNLTSQGSYELLIMMEDFSNENRYAKYTNFKIGDEKTKFKMTFSTYTGDAGDSLAHHNGRKFSTKDQDNDDHSGPCAKWHKGGWWYGACHTANLNGLYLAGNDSASTIGINWKAWKGYNYSLESTTMMIRRK
ncbi:Fibrinogen-like protein A,Ryncolin-4,Angiopoietin-related protein 7,Angiopoietin-related protein 1,Ficolin-3,Ficolin-1-B,Techylectin-5A,Ficolin-2,Ryncolin-1,Tenascin-R,Fibrinogen-like protein 1,Angiopoietin-1,Fibrinogen C domain-containing protein 1-A,Tenascin-N,Ryncolin-3,Tenascin,Fibroleukin,Fibrinogen C domain-containing protein 1,Fibrinogen gamma chain,Ryncolin-2,Angiopoietin-related protein 6,Techylectin-5B,Angiopoietin-related protein 2,Angiopoietin-2,Microfibril-associated glycoprotein 4,Ficolin-1-A|uniref:Fibrinogen C-terminal domain-containing protein n=1 Tax=Mytilus coruscus TaxID=42192 RepID=A0A6J8B1M9_MYTCO|nr:Fibrinogen-like protein A,Ryncolin-4,Angiopoietin-related protein 7,Angiopoietin-related protein 1,Ficolin-3,Ficolin-1-B,Techylectin-5A,Ficolin-2,Ryncolin-1,Tenascin-R,Fibrinogen-like protein 1,Angiopoietin-1,Fibrinogen C domain-containing protein 1-A,Tenascin-N,Ryncolin-3,Tenascin,Fibroleukin,Fibrinogen C domain-containing protein 1,Fibrinogen gamma chain,Ryncolin-2,Angiopoietin-related protein 6,Techylectin-5B,Angiopoietin-related protein 2,Angiopoietin-2,Microfibril-associated glycoprotein 4,